MDVFKLSRNFFDWSFENPEKITPTHTALYFFSIEHCNRLGWKKKFGFPTEMAKDAIGIKSYNTYIKVFNDLVDWGFFELIERSKNQYSANIIALPNFDKANDKALDKAMIKHKGKQSESNGQSIDSIDIQETNVPETNKHKTVSNDTEQAPILEESKELVVSSQGNEDINLLLLGIKQQVESLGLIYKKGKYERERAKNILTGKDFGEICYKAGMDRSEFCKNIIFISAKLDFWNGKINNAETLYKHYAQVYNEAVRKKTELSKSAPIQHEDPLLRF